MPKGSVQSEFWSFIKHQKKYWLAPFVIIFVLLALLIVFSKASVNGPFIYTLF